MIRDKKDEGSVRKKTIGGNSEGSRQRITC
jgi:hypothetical protein